MSNKEKHWGKTKGLMIVTLSLWFFFGYFIFMFGTSLNHASFLGYPLAYYMCAQGSIVAFVIILFWSAIKQEKIDDEFGFSGEEES
jgi:putative solute:sodium symporter small subunit